MGKLATSHGVEKTRREFQSCGKERRLEEQWRWNRRPECDAGRGMVPRDRVRGGDLPPRRSSEQRGGGAVPAGLETEDVGAGGGAGLIPAPGCIPPWRCICGPRMGAAHPSGVIDLETHFRKSINKSSYSRAQRGENTMGHFPSSAQRPSGRVAKPPAHPPLGFSPTPFAAQAQGTPVPRTYPPPSAPRDPTEPFTMRPEDR